VTTITQQNRLLETLHLLPALQTSVRESANGALSMAPSLRRSSRLQQLKTGASIPTQKVQKGTKSGAVLEAKTSTVVRVLTRGRKKALQEPGGSLAMAKDMNEDDASASSSAPEAKGTDELNVPWKRFETLEEAPAVRKIAVRQVAWAHFDKQTESRFSHASMRNSV
jgi:hypothetical protein